MPSASDSIAAQTQPSPPEISPSSAVCLALERVYAAWKLYGEGHPALRSALDDLLRVVSAGAADPDLGVGPRGWIAELAGPATTHSLAIKLHSLSIAGIRLARNCAANDATEFLKLVDRAGGEGISGAKFAEQLGETTSRRFEALPMSLRGLHLSDLHANLPTDGTVPPESPSWSGVVESIIRTSHGDSPAPGAAPAGSRAESQARVGEGLGRWVTQIPAEHQRILLEGIAHAGETGAAPDDRTADSGPMDHLASGTVPMEQLVVALDKTGRDASCHQTVMLLTKLSQLAGKSDSDMGSKLAALLGDLPGDTSQSGGSGLSTSLDELLQHHGAREHTPEDYKQVLTLSAAESAEAPTREIDDSEYFLQVGEIAAFLLSTGGNVAPKPDSPVLALFAERLAKMLEQRSHEPTLNAIETLLSLPEPPKFLHEPPFVQALLAHGGEIPEALRDRAIAILFRLGDLSLVAVAHWLESACLAPPPTDSMSSWLAHIIRLAVRLCDAKPPAEVVDMLSAPPWTPDSAAAILRGSAEVRRAGIVEAMLAADKRKVRILGFRMSDQFIPHWDVARLDAASQLADDPIVREIVVRRLVSDLGLRTACQSLEDRTAGLRSRDASIGVLLAEALRPYESDARVKAALRSWNRSPGRLRAIFTGGVKGEAA